MKRIVTEIKRLRDRVYMFEASTDIEDGKYTLSISKYRKNRTL